MRCSAECGWVVTAEEMIKSLLSWEPSLGEKTDSSGKTALHYASSAGKVGVVKLLLGNSTLGYISDNNGLFPVHAAAIGGNSKVIRMLMEICPRSEELFDYEHRNILHCAVKHNSVNVVWHIYRNPVFVRMMNAMDCEGNTPLHLAVKHGHARIFCLLMMDIRVNLGILNHGGLTPLQISWNKTFKNYSFSVLKYAYIWISLILCGAYPRTFQDLTDNLDLKNKEKESSIYSDVSQNILCISVLIATGSFTAVFTPPGGYIAEGVDAGKPVLGGQVELTRYMSSNTCSFLSSTFATCLLVHASVTNMRTRTHSFYLHFSALLVILAVVCLLDTFVSVVLLTLQPGKYPDDYFIYATIRLVGVASSFGLVFWVSILLATLVSFRVSRQLWASKRKFQGILMVLYFFILIILLFRDLIESTLSLIKDLYDMQDDSEYVYPT